jgi:hypothetical protein
VAESDELCFETHFPMFFPLNLKVTKPSSLNEVVIVIDVPLKTLFTFPARDIEIVGGADAH